MENTVLAERQIKDELKNFIVAKLYTDWPGAKGAKARELQRRFDSRVPLPLYVFLLPNGTVSTVIPGTTSTHNFMSALESTLKSSGSPKVQ